MMVGYPQTLGEYRVEEEEMLSYFLVIPLDAKLDSMAPRVFICVPA